MNNHARRAQITKMSPVEERDKNIEFENNFAFFNRLEMRTAVKQGI